MDDIPDDATVSILLSPDGYEMVVPLFNKKFSRIGSLVGVDTAKVYYEAKLRNDQQIESVRMRLLQMSNWPKIVSWFAIFPDQNDRVSSVAVNWMVGTADRVRGLGYEAESIIDMETMNSAIEDDINKEEV